MDVFIESELFKNEKKMAFYYLHLVACISYFAILTVIFKFSPASQNIEFHIHRIFVNIKQFEVFMCVRFLFLNISLEIGYGVGFKLWTLTD